jgi:multiple sugar transport system substrate-binding protein
MFTQTFLEKEAFMKKFMVAVLVLACMSAVYAAPTHVRWFVGLGSGGDAPTVLVEKKVVDAYNASQKDIFIDLEIVGNSQAYNTLATEISGGNSPDIVGPVGIRGRDSFKGAWADLQPLVDKYKWDLAKFDKATVDFFRTKDQGLVGLPYAIYPSFLYVNRALFKEAGIALPPQKYGAPYIDASGKSMPWDVNTLRQIAMKLTVDASGKDATDPTFDPNKIVQWGFGQQMTDLRGVATLFGAGNFVAADGKTAQIPPQWVAAIKWVNDGIWKDHFYPSKTASDSDYLDKGDWFASGHIAMSQVHTWYAGFADIAKLDWTTAAMPAYNGKITAKMHADTFEITKTSKNKDAAFKALAFLLANPDLLKAYGAMPAQKSAQAGYLADFAKAKFPNNDVNWQTVIDSIAYNDNPNHESWMPSFQETTTRYTTFYEKFTSTPGLDLAAEEKALVADMQKIFDAAK